jgi:hypothetical protein
MSHDNRSAQPPRLPTSPAHMSGELQISHSLQRNPFSGLVNSAGELLHTP